jgi:hypothetical protein
MLDNVLRYLPSRYFNLGTLFFWLSVQSVYNQIQYTALAGTDRQIDWLNGWFLLSPWFFLWCFLTVAIYVSIKIIASADSRDSLRFIMHSMVMCCLLVFYWLTSSFFYLLLASEPLSGFNAYVVQQIRGTFQLDILIYLGVWFVCKGILFYASLMGEKLEIKQLQNALINERLKTLHSQLNPHFLFNTLNTIASLVRLKREKEAVTALSELSQMLRSILENKNNDDVKVKEEISFIKSYLLIQKMRFSDKLESIINVDEDCLELEIPNMLIHPLVENAVQHGSQLESNNNLVSLNISRKHDQLVIKLTNKVVIDDKHMGFGIGLSHTQERLVKLYENYQLELNPDKNGMFETVLSIPIGGRGA